jgi:hypothetical protein
MSWQRTLLGVVIAASGGLCGCVLQGERHEDRLMNEACALAEEAADKLECRAEPTYKALCANLPGCDSDTQDEEGFVAVEPTDDGKKSEPVLAAVTPPWRIAYDCVVGQTRLRNLCGPEFTALNRCVLDLVEEKGISTVFTCYSQNDEFDDPGQKDKGGKALTITRTSPLGRAVLHKNDQGQVLDTDGEEICPAERDALAECSAGR